MCSPASRSPTSLSTINDDVFATILSFLEPKQALPLTTTCRSLHVLATQRLVSEYSVILTNPENDSTGEEKLLKFCEYMLARPERRLPWLHVLSIEVRATVGPSLALTHLADVISRATNLRSLTSRDQWRHFLYMHPSIMDAIVDIELLECITVSISGSSIAVPLLSRLKSRPRTLTCLVDSQAVYQLYKSEPIQFLDNLASNLTKLTVAGVLPIIANMRSSVICHNVKALTLNDHYIAPDHWESILRVFPDVRCLRSTSHLVEGSDASATSYTEWPELDMVQTLAPLPFHRCRVRRLELGRPLVHFYAPPEMQDFMRRVSPVALTSSLQDKRLNYVGQDLDRLRILRLVNECVEPEFDNIVHRMASALAPLHVRALLIDLGGTQCDGGAIDHLRPHVEAITSAVQSLHLIGMRFEADRDFVKEPFDIPVDHDYRSWSFTSQYKWYYVMSRGADGVPQLRTLAGDDVARVVSKLLLEYQFSS